MSLKYLKALMIVAIAVSTLGISVASASTIASKVARNNGAPFLKVGHHHHR